MKKISRQRGILISRRLFLGRALALLAALAPGLAFTENSTGSELRTVMIGWERFKEVNFQALFGSIERERALIALRNGGISAETVRRLAKQDFLAGRVCELRGVMLSQTECVFFAEAVRG